MESLGVWYAWFLNESAVFYETLRGCSMSNIAWAWTKIIVRGYWMCLMYCVKSLNLRLGIRPGLCLENLIHYIWFPYPVEELYVILIMCCSSKIIWDWTLLWFLRMLDVLYEVIVYVVCKVVFVFVFESLCILAECLWCHLWDSNLYATLNTDSDWVQFFYSLFLTVFGVLCVVRFVVFGSCICLMCRMNFWMRDHASYRLGLNRVC